ncbi:MAG: zinc metalloprotease [Bdellovibrio sp. ArHS]|uniref:RIP metalloprotease RseP n=1 Tax=Bdellovibrio sp. ArHS TaxID=1569284 RepID=UPI0005824FA3|nr:RIP metalloprotease RseP [Bdellovibrio sp. ArHS]KHD88035.1 MAG: zinc metalloprotease [Bdellovibrio sp. ArHS]
MNIFSYLQSGLSAIIPFVILLGILIFVHELGHFLVARWCGVRVEVFSLGFGKKLLKYKKGDTTYALSLIPLGGYVKMFGEQPGDHISDEDKKHSFTHKNVWQRIAVVIAGPLMNFLFAVLVFFAVALIGEDAKTPVVGDVAQNTPAYAAGFRSGDKVVSINETPVNTWEDLQRSLSLKENHNLHIDVVVQREGTGETAKIATDAKAEPNPNVLSSYDYVANVDGLTPYSAGTTIGVLEGSPLAALGVQTGDSIMSINGQKVSYWRQLEDTLAKQNAKEPLTIEIMGLREGDKEAKPLTITLAPTASIKTYSMASLGFESSELYLSKVMDNSPAKAAGLHAMDRLISINNVALKKWEDVINNIKSFDGKNPVALTVLRDGQKLNLNITPKMTTQMLPTGTEEKRYTIGIAPIANIAAPELMIVRSENIGQAFARGVEKTWDVSVMTVMSFVRLFQAKISPKNIGGVISIGQAASETFKIGLTQFLQMMAIISVNLFILNLLPIPVLDGGHLVFYAIEVVKGAPLSMRKMELAQQVGLALLMSLMIFALFNDFTRILGL